MKKLIFLIIIAIQQLYVFSQEETAAKSDKPMNLQECIDYAWSNNLTLKQQLLNVQFNESKLWQSRAGLLPDLNAGATHVYNYGRTVDRYTNQFANDRIQSNNFYLSSTLTVFSGFQLLNSVKQSQLNLISSKLDVDQAKDDLALNVATAYLQVLYCIEMLENAQGQQNIIRQQVEKTAKLVEAGSLAKGNLLTIQSQEANENLQVVNAQNQLDIAYLVLSQLLELPSKDGFEIQKPMLSVYQSETMTLNPEMIYNTALNSQPSVKSAEIKIQSAEKSLAMAKGMISPSIRFQGSWGTGFSGASRELNGTPQISGYDIVGLTTGGDSVLMPNFIYDYIVTPFNDQISSNNNYTVGFYLNIPIFNAYQTGTAIKQAKISIEQAENNLLIIKNNLRKTIQQAHADAIAAMNKYKATEKSVSALEESFSYTEQKFNVGMVSSLDYNDSKNKLALAKSELLQAKYEYVFRVKVLEYYMGKPIEIK